MSALSVIGDLKDIDAAVLVRSLCASSETGVLRVTAGANERELYFSEGQVVYTRSTWAGDRLGAFLVEQGSS